MDAKRFLTSLLMGALILPRLAGAEDRMCPITFTLLEARFDDKGKIIEEVPRPDVTIRLHPDQFTAGEASRPGQTDAHGKMIGLIVSIPANKPPGTACGHLELTDNEPWGPEETYFLWRYGYSSTRHDDPFEIERHQPTEVLLIPIARVSEYYQQRVLPRSAANASAYFRDLIHDSLSPEPTLRVQPLAQSFAATKEIAIQHAADYWKVRPEEITAGLNSWAADAKAAPPGQRDYDKVLATAFEGDLVKARDESLALASGTSEADEKAKFTFTSANLSVVLARDLVSKSEGRIPASESREEMLEKARVSLGQALQQYSAIGDAAAVQALLAKGAEVNAKTNDGATALMAASQNGHLDVVQALLAKGAEVNAKDNNGATALILASRNGHRDVVQALERTFDYNVQVQNEISRNTATEYQRRIAERNAEVFFSHLPPAKKSELKKRDVHSVLIPTVRGPKTSPKAKDVRMRFDLHNGHRMDDDVREYKTALTPKTIIKTEGGEEYINLSP